MLIFSLWYLLAECVEVAQRCHGECSDFDIRRKKTFSFFFIFFAKSAVGHLNGLPREVVDASCLSVFKWHLDNALNGIS